MGEDEEKPHGDDGAEPVGRSMEMIPWRRGWRERQGKGRPNSGEDGENFMGKTDIIPWGGDETNPTEMVELSHWEDGDCYGEDGDNPMGRTDIISWGGNEKTPRR